MLSAPSPTPKVDLKGDSKVLLAHVHDLLAQMTVNENGSVSFSSLSHRDLRMQLVAAKIVIDEFRDTGDVKGLIDNALAALKKQGLDKPDSDQFKRAVEQAISDYVAKPVREFRIIFALNVKGQWIRGKTSFSFGNTTFKQLNSTTLRSLPGWTKFLGEASSTVCLPDLDDVLNRHFTLFEAIGHGRNETVAFEGVNEAFDVIRSIVNMQTVGARLIYRLGGSPSPFGSCLPPPVYPLFDLAGEYITYWVNTERYGRYSSRELKATDGAEIEKILGQIETMNTAMRSFVVDFHLKYVQALDTAEWRSAFLWLWQVLESIASPTGQEVKFADVVKRIAFLLSGRGKLLEDVLKTIESARHQLVHRGQFPRDASSEINWLKFVAEGAMSNVMRLATDFADPQSLLDYYTYGPRSNSELERQRRSISTLLNQRERRKP